MRLLDLQFIRLLPNWMRDDLAIQGLAKGIDDVSKPLVDAMKDLPIWDRIDELPEELLDELAWEFNLLWYDKSAGIQTKRDLVRNGLNVWSKLGTKWAVENVITAYFGDGYVKEWFEYEGLPGRFRVYSTNPSVTNERLQEFMNILNIVKRFTAKLDGIYITLTGETPLSAGVAYREVTKEVYTVNMNPQEGG
ncbi:MAG: phage tail protein I [Peptococcaceae bacterium]|nr:phage tail protein I [Peptococcaceae bacterium]